MDFIDIKIEDKFYVTVQDHPFKPFKGMDFDVGTSLQEIVDKLFPQALHERVEVYINDVSCSNLEIQPLPADSVHVKFLQGEPVTGITAVGWAILGAITVGAYLW